MTEGTLSADHAELRADFGDRSLYRWIEVRNRGKSPRTLDTARRLGTRARADGEQLRAERPLSRRRASRRC